METFIKKCAKDIYSKYHSEFHNLILVFPNKRPAAFFVKELSLLIDKPILQPKIHTINELFAVNSKLQIIDTLQLVIKLYNIYAQKTKNAESFDDFYFWGEMLLNDFDDIDKYLVNAQDLFRNLASVKSIENQFDYLTEEQISAIKQFWGSFDINHLSSHQDDFLRLWDILFDIYTEFKASLYSQGVAFDGMISRWVIENINNKDVFDTNDSIYVFIGFNALNLCEEKLFEYLNNKKQALFYWDMDNYYVNNNFNEAGLFMRNNIKQFPVSNENFGFSNILADKLITITASPNQTAQAKYLSELIVTLSAENDYSDTAVVLANENFLMPVLYSIPDCVENVNVTMGYPFSISPLFAFLESLLNLQKNASVKGFYYKDVIPVLSSVYIHQDDSIATLRQKIVEQNLVRISGSFFSETNLQSTIFKTVDNGDDLLKYLIEAVCNIASNVGSGILQNVEKEFLYAVYSSLNRLHSTLLSEHIIIENKSLAIKFIRKVISSLSVPFEGDPLNGLQVLGVLETRLLDFKNVIILSLNEGVFPKGKAAPSFVPHNLRSGFGIPTLKHQDAIFSYYFYRLLQRADNIHLMYSKQTTDESKGEMSRFISQLKFSGDFTITENELSVQVSGKSVDSISIKKDEKVLQCFDDYFSGNRTLSPTALNEYIDCELKFYFHHIERLKETNEVHEMMDNAEFGRIFHYVMEQIYTPFIGKVITSDILVSIKQNESQLTSYILQGFNKYIFFNDDINSSVTLDGYNEIIFSVLKFYLNNVLDSDIAIAPFTILGLEKQVSAELSIANNKTVILDGLVDRIDLIDGVVRIIDYKTGKGELSLKSVESIFDSENQKRNQYALQAFFYSYIYSKHIDDKYPIAPALYAIREHYKKQDCFFKLGEERKKIEVKDFNTLKSEYETLLIDSINNIFDLNRNFIQTTNDKICGFCPYKQICKR